MSVHGRELWLRERQRRIGDGDVHYDLAPVGVTSLSVEEEPLVDDLLPLSARGRRRDVAEALRLLREQSMGDAVRGRADPYAEALAELAEAARVRRARNAAIVDRVLDDSLDVGTAIDEANEPYLRALGRVMNTWNAPARWLADEPPVDPCPCCGAPREQE